MTAPEGKKPAKQAGPKKWTVEEKLRVLAAAHGLQERSLELSFVVRSCTRPSSGSGSSLPPERSRARTRPPRLPVVVGMEQAPSPTPMLDAVLEEAEAELPAGPTKAQIDGQRVAMEGKDDVVLRCGKASITPRRNGRMVLRGVYLEILSSCVTRIKCSSVEVN